MSSPSTSSNLSPQLKRKRQADSTHSDSEPSSSESEQDVDDTPETVSALSHAERRRQKKRGNQSGKEDKPSEAKKRKVTAGAAKRQNSVWVGNLCFKTTLEALKGFFDGVGEITRVHMPMKATAPNAKPENRGWVLHRSFLSFNVILTFSFSFLFYLQVCVR
jgi:RNA recognition motif-containing protein